jgi:serine protease Do
VTLGIVSNARMILPGGIRGQGQFTLDGEDVGSMVRWIGHDAEIQPGNSGGPLVNLQGQVIGINEIGIGSMSGAIPGNLARWVADQLIKHGRVSRSWLGVQVQPLLKQDAAGVGVLISDVTKDSPAAAAGVLSGDVLLRVAGQEVRGKFWEELPLFNQMVAQLPVGKEVELVVRRGAEEKKLTAKTADRERALPGARELKEWGMTVRDLSARLAFELRRENRAGALVTSVRPGGAAGQALPALRPGDVITAVNDAAITNCAALAEWTQKVLAATNAPVPSWISFDRKAEKLATVVKVGLRDMDDPSTETPKAWLPVSLQAVTREMAAQLGNPKLTGVRVTQVFANSSAEKAGLKVGDLLVALDKDPIAVGQVGEEEVFWRQIRQYKIGTPAELQVRRGAETLTLTVELVRAPRAEREMKKYRDTIFEFVARDLTFRDRVEERRPEDLQGGLVTEVKGGGWAALGRLGTGDIIVAVNGQAVEDVDSLQAAMKQIGTQRPKSVVWRVLRGIHTLYLEIEPDWGNQRPVADGDLE